MLLKPTFTAAPYPGLRPFESEECDIFFGRERQTDELLEKLQRNRFLAVVGPSGCGKSSLVRAGLIAALETGFMSEAGTRWRVARMRPGDRPILRLATSLLAPALLGRERGDRPDAALYLEAALRRGPLGLVEVASESGLCRDANLLVLADQFEEVFRFRSQSDPEEADAFVALLLASAAHRSLPVYVIITMRSDFLGDCSLFRDLPEAINRSAYLIPRLTRDECAAAITGPARVFDGEVEPALVNRLLNDFGPDPDQLPLLQHALMRMWYRRTHAASFDPSGRLTLAVADYEALGGLSRALSDHADEVMQELTPEGQRLARIIFQRLTERGSGKRDTRAPARLDDIARVAGVEVSEVRPVIEAFRQPGRCFLTPLEGPLEPDTLIDIGHESLIRQWKQLSAWVDEEAQSARVYGRLRETARLWEAGQAALWSNPDLGRAVQWKERATPNEAWATRYGQPEDFARAMRFLQASEAEHQRREAESSRARERALRHARRLAWTLGAIIVALLCTLAGYWYGWIREYEAHYNLFVKVHGVPRGIGALTGRQVAHRPWSLKIVKAGRRGLVQRMEAVDSRGRPSTRHGIGTYLSESQGVPQRREVRWEFLYDANGHVAHEVAYDRSGNRVWGLIYSPTDAAEAHSRVAHFVGPDGYVKQASGYGGGGYVSIEYSREGYEAVVASRNALGEPRPGLDRAFGRRQAFDAEGRLIEMVSIGPDGKPMVDQAGNAGLTITRDHLGNGVEYVGTDASGARTTLKDGWSMVRAKYDANGNQVELAYFDERDQPALHKDGNHRVSFTTDERGNVSESRYWDIDGKPTLVAGCHAFRFVYDDRDNVVGGTCLGIEGKPAPNEKGVTTTRMTYDDRDNVIGEAYFDEADQPVFSSDGHSRIVYEYDARGNSIRTAYHGLKGEPVPTKDGYSSTTSQYDTHDNETARTYLGTDGRPIVIAQDADDRSDVGSGRVLSYASLKRAYDENGNLTYEAYFDQHGQPMMGPDGYASWRATYDLSGNRIEGAYFGVNGERVVGKSGYAGWRAEYNELGRRTRIAYLGVRGEPVTSNEGVAGFTSSYNAQGNLTEEAYFGLDGRPVSHINGNAALRIRYDRRGEPTDYEFVDVGGNPTLRFWNPSRPEEGGLARRSFKYDARNRILEHAFFGVHGERVRNPDGWARVVNRYDLRGTEAVETAYFDEADRPATVRRGFHAVRQLLDRYGRVIAVTFHDVRLLPVRTIEGYAKLVMAYDSHGRRIADAIFGTDGSPTLNSSGFHKSGFRYDERGQLIEQRYFGRGDEPVRYLGRFQHATRFGYDERGNKIDITHFDADGRPTPGPDISGQQVCVHWTGTYDADRKLLTSKCETRTSGR